MKKLLLIVGLFIGFSLSAMEQDAGKSIEVITTEGATYIFDEGLLSLSQTLMNLINDLPMVEDAPIPLPPTISNEHFKHCFAWLNIIKNGTDNNRIIDAIMQYTYDHDLKGSTLASLIDIVEYLDIRLPGLLEALEVRRDCIKLELQDAEVWISPGKLQQCTAFGNILDTTADDPIDLPQMTRETFESITGLEERKVSKHHEADAAEFVIPPQLIETIIHADWIGNEKVLQESVKSLCELITKNLNDTSLDTIATCLKNALSRVPQTIHYLLCQELIAEVRERSELQEDFEKKIRIIVRFDALQEQDLLPYILFCYVTQEIIIRSKNEKDEMKRFRNVFRSRTYKKFPDYVKKAIKSSYWPPYYTSIQEYSSAHRINFDYPVLSNIFLGATAGFTGSILNNFITNYLSTFSAMDDSLLASSIGVSTQIGLYYVCYKLATSPICDSVQFYSLSSNERDLWGMYLFNKKAIRFFAALCGAGAGSMLGKMIFDE